MEQLKFYEYWSGGKNHVEASSSDIFNLWRIVDSEKDLYARNVEKYFNSNFFRNKDLSFVSLSMVEAYYNIFDHAYSGGNAFSIIKYDSEKEILNVAICDFGIGIAKSVRTFNNSIKNDKDALAKSIEVDFTVGSKSHNKGKGLDNILCCSDVVRILANNAMLVKSGNVRFFDTDFDFRGTLIYFDLCLKEAEEEEVLDEFII